MDDFDKSPGGDSPEATAGGCGGVSSFSIDYRSGVRDLLVWCDDELFDHSHSVSSYQALDLLNSIGSGGSDPCFITTVIQRRRAQADGQAASEGALVACANYSGGRCVGLCLVLVLNAGRAQQAGTAILRLLGSVDPCCSHVILSGACVMSSVALFATRHDGRL